MSYDLALSASNPLHGFAWFAKQTMVAPCATCPHYRSDARSYDLALSSQYIHLYTLFSGSVSLKMCGMFGSIAVMHLGFLHFWMFTSFVGSATFFFSTVTPSLIIQTVTPGSM